ARLGGRAHRRGLRPHRPGRGNDHADLDRLLAEGAAVDEREAGDRRGGAGSREGLEDGAPRGGAHRWSSAPRVRDVTLTRPAYITLPPAASTPRPPSSWSAAA